MKLLHFALQKQDYNLAAYILVYGLIKTQLEAKTKPTNYYGNKGNKKPRQR